MNKEKDIKEMAKELHCATNESFISCRKIARILVERHGYGNVNQYQNEINAIKEQAVVKYADKLASHIAGHSDYHGDNILSAIRVLAEGREIKDVKYLNISAIRQQAVKEFAEKLKEQMELNGYRSPLHNRIIDNLITELYRADE